MSAQSTFSQTPVYQAHVSSPKEVAAEEALVYEGAQPAVGGSGDLFHGLTR
jgi:hypothetical protein